MSINSINNSDFIHPDDIVHRSNGTVYIKHLKCQHCPYKSAWPGEITRHEARVHGIIRNPSDLDSPHLPRNNSSGSKKAPRPIPNLIPIQGKPTPSGKSILKSSQSLLKVYINICTYTGWGRMHFLVPKKITEGPPDRIEGQYRSQ